MINQKNVLPGIGMMAILTVLSKLVRFIVLMVTARFLTSGDFGVVAAFSLVLALANLVANGGIEKTLIQRPAINQAHVGSALLLSFLLSAIVALVLFFDSGLIEGLVGVEGIQLPLKIAAFLFLFLAASNICTALFQRNGDVVFIGKVQAFATIFGNLCITVPLVFFGLGYWSIIIGILTTELITVVLVIWQGRFFLKISIAKKECIEILRYSSAFFLHNFIYLISKQIDIALVGRYLGKDNLGNYSRSIQLIELPSQIYWLVVDRVVFPTMSSMKNKKELLREYFLEIYSLLLIVLCVGTLILFFGANEIIHITMGTGWESVIVLLKILSVTIVLRCITVFMDSYVGAYGAIKALTYKNITSLIIFAVSIFVGVRFGLQGVAYGMVFASLANFLIVSFTVVYCSHVNIKQFIIANCYASLTSLFIILLYAIIKMFVSIPDLITIIISVLLWASFCFVYPSAYLLSPNGSKFVLKIKLKKDV